MLPSPDCCNYCQAPVEACDMSGHLECCSKYFTACPKNCGRQLSREAIPHHISATGDCERKQCPFGCSENSREHAQNAAPAHCSALLKMSNGLKKQVELWSDTMAVLNRQIETLLRQSENREREKRQNNKDCK